MFAAVTYSDLIVKKIEGLVTYNDERTLWIVLTVVFAVVGYLIGSLNVSILYSRIVYKDDIRTHGSHNAGATNVNRTYGTRAGIAVFLLDLLKGFLAFTIAQFVIGESAACIAGFACSLGHCFPVYFGFKGGKGVSASFGVALAIDPAAALVMLLIFVLMVAGTKYISMGSITAAAMYPLILNKIFPVTHVHLLPDIFISLGSIALALLIILRHRANIVRLLNHEESKISFSFKKK